MGFVILSGDAGGVKDLAFSFGGLRRFAASLLSMTYIAINLTKQ